MFIGPVGLAEAVGVVLDKDPFKVKLVEDLLTALEAEFGEAVRYSQNSSDEEIKNASLVLYTVATYDSEGSDVSFNLKSSDNVEINRLTRLNENVGVIMYTGGGRNMSLWNDKVEAILYGWYPGQIGNQAIAEIISGATNPSGKLPITIEKEFEDSPGFPYLPDGEELYNDFEFDFDLDHPIHDIVYDEGIFVDLDDVKVEKKQGGSIKDSSLVDGIILDKERVHSGMPRAIDGAKIALVNSAIEVKKTEVDAKIQITDPSMLSQFLDEEESYIKGLVDKISASGANVLICQKGIDDLAQHHMAKSGIFAIRRAKKSDMEALSKATGGRVVTTLEDLSKDDLGNASKVDERKIGDSDMVFITGCKQAKAVSVLLRGGTEHVVDEIRRAFDDAIGVVSVAHEDGKVLTGGGSVLAAVSRDLRSYAEGVGGREQMAIEAFAGALEVIPRTLAENAGLDPVNTIIALRKAHSEGKTTHGVNVYDGGVVDMQAGNVYEPTRVVEQAIQSASETAVMILRIDDVISSKGGASEMGAEFDGMDM